MTHYKEEVFWKCSEFDEVELLFASYENHSFPKHLHNEYCVGVMIEGGADLQYMNNEYDVTKGSIITLNAGEVHQNHSVKGAYRMFYISQNFFSRFFYEVADIGKVSPSFKQPVTRAKQTDNIYRELMALHKKLEIEGDLISKEELFIEAITGLVTIFSDSKLVLLEPSQDLNIARKVRDFLRSHYQNNISIHQISDHFNITPYHLSRIFSKDIGLPIHKYLNSLRISESQKMLRKGKKSSHIATQVGFNDHSHFCKQFKKEIGITPTQYQKAAY